MRAAFVSFVIAAVFLTFYGVHYTTQVDIVRGEHRELTSQVAEMTKAVQASRDLLVQHQELAPYLVAAAQAQTEVDAARDRLAGIKGEIERAQSLFAVLVRRARTEAPGTSIPDMRLRSGQLLRNAKIMRIDGGTLTIAHDGGVTSLTDDQLSDDLRLRFGYSFNLPNHLFPADTQVVKSRAIPEVVIPAPSSSTESKSARQPATHSGTNRYRDGDPALWNGVTRQELGRAYIPGQGWLKVGPRGPIPKSSR
jgi:hypothetical protein